MTTESKDTTTTTTTTTTSSGPNKHEENEVDGNHDLHVTPKKKKKDKKKKETGVIDESATINQIEAAMAQFGLHANSKTPKTEKESHTFWDTQPVPKKGISITSTSQLRRNSSFHYKRSHYRREF
jgi:hypothetical protein